MSRAIALVLLAVIGFELAAYFSGRTRRSERGASVHRLEQPAAEPAQEAPILVVREPLSTPGGEAGAHSKPLSPDPESALRVSPRRVRVERPDGTEVWLEMHPVEKHEDRDQFPPVGSSLVDGVLTIFHANGAVAEIGGWDGSARQGLWTYFEDNGMKVLENEYIGGLAHGKILQWSEVDGSLRSEGMAVNGQLDGPCRFWNADGTLDTIRTGTYRAGTKVP